MQRLMQKLITSVLEKSTAKDSSPPGSYRTRLELWSCEMLENWRCAKGDDWRYFIHVSGMSVGVRPEYDSYFILKHQKAISRVYFSDLASKSDLEHKLYLKEPDEIWETYKCLDEEDWGCCGGALLSNVLIFKDGERPKVAFLRDSCYIFGMAKALKVDDLRKENVSFEQVMQETDDGSRPEFSKLLSESFKLHNTSHQTRPVRNKRTGNNSHFEDEKGAVNYRCSCLSGNPVDLPQVELAKCAETSHVSGLSTKSRQKLNPGAPERPRFVKIRSDRGLSQIVQVMDVPSIGLIKCRMLRRPDELCERFPKQFGTASIDRTRELIYTFDEHLVHPSQIQDFDVQVRFSAPGLPARPPSQGYLCRFVWETQKKWVWNKNWTLSAPFYYSDCKRELSCLLQHCPADPDGQSACRCSCVPETSESPDETLLHSGGRDSVGGCGVVGRQEEAECEVAVPTTTQRTINRSP